MKGAVWGSAHPLNSVIFGVEKPTLEKLLLNCLFIMCHLLFSFCYKSRTDFCLISRCHSGRRAGVEKLGKKYCSFMGIFKRSQNSCKTTWNVMMQIITLSLIGYARLDRTTYCIVINAFAKSLSELLVKNSVSSWLLSWPHDTMWYQK